MENKIRVSEYAAMKNVSTTAVYLWEKLGKVKIVKEYGMKLVVLTDEEVEQRKSLFSQHPTKGLHKISEVMDAMFNKKQ